MKVVSLCLALAALMATVTGCCCGYLHGCNPYWGLGGPMMSPCGPGGCAPNYYSVPGSTGSTSYYQGYGASASMLEGTGTPTATAPTPATTAQGTGTTAPALPTY
ncbi:MAG: hypothetical protein KatS3mg114_1383 [Planctomycetaceae bacterium]|nr:MAG: hypothetical protein KatS3mg114_1383 [Planctomycetaceae bacterium]